VTTQIAEWQPATIRSALGLLFFASVLAVVAILARIGRPTPWTTLANLAVFFAIGAYAIRGIAWWPIAAVVALAPMLAQDPALRDEVEEVPKPANRLLAGAVGITILALLPFWRPPDPGLHAPLGVVGFAPSDITRELRAIVRPDDRIFAPQAWGSWIEFAFPEATVATDSRIEMYPKDVWDAYAQVTHAEDGWDKRLDEWGVTVVLARDEGEGPLVDALEGNAAWRQLYSDEDGHFYVRADR
jgi:hypothetical protein